MKTKEILVVLKVVAWIAMIGYAIKCGAIIISYLVSLKNPIAANDLYEGLSYYDLHHQNFWSYTAVVSFVVVVLGIKVEVWIQAINLLSDFKFEAPFQRKTIKVFEKIGYSLLTIAIVTIIGNSYIDWVNRHYELNYQQFNSTEESLFAAGIVYILSQIFKRGVELQEENELTV